MFSSGSLGTPGADIHGLKGNKKNRYFWVKAYVVIAGNKTPDRVAKVGAGIENISVQVKLSS